MLESQEPEFTDKRQRFIEEYTLDCNATQAAIRAGFSAPTARQMGSWLLTNIDIRAAVDERLRAKALAADEALKLTADIALTRLNDFMVVRQVQGYEQVAMRLKDLVAQKESEIEFVREFFNREGLYSEEDKKPFAEKLTKLRQELLDALLQLEVHGPDATVLVAGAPAVVEVADLDLVALARAKEAGRLKTFKHTKDGIQIEMLDAQAALRDILKMHGKFVNKVEHTGSILTGIQLVDFDGSPVQDV